MFIASVCLSVRPSVCLSVCLKPKFGRLKTRFDDDADNAFDGSAKRTRKTKFGPTFYVFYKASETMKPRTGIKRWKNKKRETVPIWDSGITNRRIRKQRVRQKYTQKEAGSGLP